MRETLAGIAASERVLLGQHQDRVRTMERVLLLVGILTGALAFGVQAGLRAVRRRRATRALSRQPAVA